MRKPVYLFLAGCLLCCFSGTTNAQADWPHGRLRVTADGHFLAYADETPFFWLGDTGWELFHRLTYAEIAAYLDNRQAKGFTVIQAVLLPEFDGLRKPNQYGQLPLHGLDPDKPNEGWFRLVDSVVHMARRRGLFMALLPTWGDKVTRAWGVGPVVFDSSKAYRYGKWLGRRYAKEPNIIWVLGGDRPPKNDTADWTPVWRRMAAGIREATAGQCLITYHPSGGPRSTSVYIHNEPWLDLNMFQSGHGGGHDVPCWELVYRDRSLLPVKPTLDAEPNYEDHPVNPWPVWDPANGYYRAYDVRKQCYRSVFAGACGVTYGHHSVWQFYSPREEKINYADRYWTEALDRPGATQVGCLRRLIESWGAFDRIPDTSLIVSGQGVKGGYSTAFVTRDRRLAMVYMPLSRPLVVNTSGLAGDTLDLTWWDPRRGEYLSSSKIANKGRMMLVAPTCERLAETVSGIDSAGEDRVAILSVPLRSRMMALYHDSIPNSLPGPDEERSDTKDGVFVISKISRPAITMYAPPAGLANGTAVIICPGGGYWVEAAVLEGQEIAQRFTQAGVTAFVLKYRLPNDRTMVDRSIGALQDAQQAIRLVREHSGEWGVDSSRIGIMGFSAGGHLASMAATHFQHVLIPNPAGTSVRPDFLILGYPVITCGDAYGRGGSCEQLIGKNPTPEQVREFSSEMQVTDATPPTFLLHASDDTGVPPQNSILFYEALLQHHVPVEMHLYASGGHGFGLHLKGSSEDWMERCIHWMGKNGWLKVHPTRQADTERLH